MWLTFKNILLEGTTKFVPIVKNFLKHLWNKPTPNDTKDKIKEKNKLWKKYLKSKSCLVYDQYKKVRNTVRSTTRNLLKEEQNKIAKDCRSDPKKIWNYMPSSTIV